MLLLYNVLLYLASPLWLPWMLWRSAQRAEKPNWRERRGIYTVRPSVDGKRVWLHAVSVGEVIAALPILRELRDRMPDFEILLSVTTSSGHKTAEERAKGLFNHLVYFPIDLPHFQKRALRSVMPKALVIMETELWLNCLIAAKSVGACTLLVNGRISDRSFPRSMKLRAFYRTLLRNLDRALMQTEKDAERIRQLGARNAVVVGNAKFDEAIEGLDSDPISWRESLGCPLDRPSVIVGSTRGAEEEDFIFAALQEIDEQGFSILWAPRHVERAGAIGERLAELFGRVAFRSRGERGSPMVLDTYGELSKIYSVADIVIVGGGFANFGGQNLIQPLAHGKPVLHGSHMQNFADVVSSADAQGAAFCCATPQELGSKLKTLLGDPNCRVEMGAAAMRLVQGNLGSSAKYAAEIASECRRKPTGN